MSPIARSAAEVLEQDMAEHGAWYGIISNAGIARDGAFRRSAKTTGTR